MFFRVYPGNLVLCVSGDMVIAVLLACNNGGSTGCNYMMGFRICLPRDDYSAAIQGLGLEAPGVACAFFGSEARTHEVLETWLAMCLPGILGAEFERFTWPCVIGLIWAILKGAILDPNPLASSTTA